MILTLLYIQWEDQKRASDPGLTKKVLDIVTLALAGITGVAVAIALGASAPLVLTISAIAVIAITAVTFLPPGGGSMGKDAAQIVCNATPGMYWDGNACRVRPSEGVGGGDRETRIAAGSAEAIKQSYQRWLGRPALDTEVNDWLREASQYATPGSAKYADIIESGIRDSLEASLRRQGLTRAAGGVDVVRRPTLFMAGEAGPEIAAFAPLRGGRGFGGGVTVNLNIGSVDSDERVDQLERVGGRLLRLYAGG